MRLASDLVIDAVISPGELRAEIVQRYRVLVGKVPATVSRSGTGFRRHDRTRARRWRGHRARARHRRGGGGGAGRRSAEPDGRGPAPDRYERWRATRLAALNRPVSRPVR